MASMGELGGMEMACATVELKGRSRGGANDQNLNQTEPGTANSEQSTAGSTRTHLGF